MKAKKPIFTPPVQVSHLYYRLARVLVWAGMTRYHKVHGAKRLKHIPAKGTPAIFVSNHQNGMMDPLVSCSFVPQQIHWLTRADVFWNPMARHIMYGFNQMPIYRQRDRVQDIRERNDIIFDVCVERLHAGAAMGIFPEGNHHPFPALRPFKGGLSEMLARAAHKYPDLRHLQVVPVGVDYEDYAEFRRQLRVRSGPPVPFHDLLDAEGGIDKKAFNERLRLALAELVVNIQPSEAQPILHPAVRATRSTELSDELWETNAGVIASLAERWTQDEEWREAVKKAHAQWEQAWERAGRCGRPEAWGMKNEDTRVAPHNRRWMTPIALLLNLPSLPTELLIQRVVSKTVKQLEFVSTMTLGYGMILFPLTWLIESIIAGLVAPPGLGWIAAGCMWVWGQVGSRIRAWIVSKQHESQDAVNGTTFWNDPKMEGLRNAWKHYLDVVHS